MSNEWLDTLLAWVQANPAWAGAIIFLTAFTESLAIVGIIMPGAFILFGLGTLIAFGVLDLYTTWLWCTLGAIAGDGVSFWLGHHYRDRLRSVWPFSRYRELMARGEVFFQKHGVKSIAIGRFVGPVRPIIPVTAGMMGMPVGKYITVNVIASILWSPAYLLPGVAFGKSIELAAAVATRLAILVGLIVGLAWLSWWLVSHANRFLAPRASRMIARAMAWSLRHPTLGRYTTALIDPAKPESPALIALGAGLIVAIWGLLSLLIRRQLQHGAGSLDVATYSWFQSLRTPFADLPLAMVNAIGDPLVLLGSSTIVLFWLVRRRRFHAARHWLAAIGFSLVATLVLRQLLSSDALATLPVDGFSFPSLSSALVTTVFGFFAVMVAPELPRRKRNWPYVTAALMVLSVSFSDLYLGAVWLTDVLAGILLGALWVAVLGIAYRRRVRRSFWCRPLTTWFLVSVLIGTVWVGASTANDRLNRFKPPTTVVQMSAEQWWDNGWQNVAGFDDTEYMPALNLQFAGQPDQLAQRLQNAGWQLSPPFSWTSALQALLPEPTVDTLPLLHSDLDGDSETLLMYSTSNNGLTVLRLWPARVQLGPTQTPVWRGVIAEHTLVNHLYFFSNWEYDLPYTQAASEQLREALGEWCEKRKTETPAQSVLLCRP
ncbi:MAG: membrane protein [Lysobacteraceae bacterium]|nr:MAG: membrane protein [Xanthomonadaceae bacterium]